MGNPKSPRRSLVTLRPAAVYHTPAVPLGRAITQIRREQHDPLRGR
jgi:hypothetical protein